MRASVVCAVCDFTDLARAKMSIVFIVDTRLDAMIYSYCVNLFIFTLLFGVCVCACEVHNEHLSGPFETQARHIHIITPIQT